jgi:hypothetical protein
MRHSLVNRLVVAITVILVFAGRVFAVVRA